MFPISLLFLAACTPGPQPGEAIPADPKDESVYTIDELGRGELVISEIMRRPTQVPDRFGEYFEIRNNKGDSIDLEGLVVSDDSGQSFTIDTSVILTEVLVIGGSTDSSRNGGATVDSAWGRDTFGLEASDVITLSNSAGLIDRVAFAGPRWRTEPGVALALDVQDADSRANDGPDSWCAVETTYGEGDHGSPGSAAEDCAEPDRDGDGADTDTDCDDRDASVYPGAPETDGDGVDSNCDDADDAPAAEIPAELEAGSWTTTTTAPTSSSECGWVEWSSWPIGFGTDPVDADTFGLDWDINGWTAESECEFSDPDVECSTGQYVDDPGDGSYVITIDQQFSGSFSDADTLEGSASLTVTCQSGELCDLIELKLPLSCEAVFDGTWTRG